MIEKDKSCGELKMEATKKAEASKLGTPPPGVTDFVPDPALYPFTSRWFNSSVGPIHYVDEGHGRPLLMVHGNPDWSFLYRHIITQLRGNFRCIAADFPGFGLSVHPKNYGYMPEDHARILGELVDALDLQDAIVIGADWGGPIGMEIASLRPQRFSGLVMGNTFYWPQRDWKVRTFSRLMGTSFMQYLIKRHHFMVRTILPSMVQGSLSKDEFDHYSQVASTPAQREGYARLPVAAVQAESWLKRLEARVQSKLRDKPAVLTFGERDPILAAPEVINRWQHDFPNAQLVRMPDAGHFFQEDAPEIVCDAVIASFG